MSENHGAATREWVRAATPYEISELRGQTPVGIAWWWRVDEDWRVPPEGAGRCRWMQARKACGKPAVASFLRGWGKNRHPWDYCAEHLYGRRFEDGRVLVLVARPKGDVLLLHHDNAATDALPADWQPSHVLHTIQAARRHLETLGCRHRYERGECVSCVLRSELRRLGIDVPSNWREPFSHAV